MRLPLYGAAFLLAAMAGACDRGVQDPAEVGAAEIWVATPEAGDQAMILRFDGRVEAFVPAPGVRHFLAISGAGSRLVVVTADPLPGGGAFLGTARWARGAGPGDVAIEQVARWDFEPRADLSRYSVEMFPR